MPRRKEPSFTLEEFAHFDRCLFPGNLKEDLVAEGLDSYTARCVSDNLIREGKIGIVGLYQEYINSEDIKDILFRLLSKHVENYRSLIRHEGTKTR